MDPKGKIYMYAQCVEPGWYQVFIKNISYPADFFSYAIGKFEKLNGKKVFHTSEQGIISPFHKDLKIYKGSFTLFETNYRKTYFIDTKLRKPTRPVEMLEAIAPPVSKLKNTIGSETDFEIKLRKKQVPIDTHLDSIRVNTKEYYEYLIGQLRLIKSVEGSDDLGATKKLYLSELLKINELASLYNQGVKPADIGGLEHPNKYRWLIDDFGLEEPNGGRPTKPLAIDLGLEDEK